MVLLISYFLTGSILNKDNGITTELAIVFSYLIGFFISLQVFPYHLIIAMVIILVGILNIKNKLHSFIEKIKDYEFKAFLSYAIITLVVLPFLPNQNFGISDIPNFSSILNLIGINTVNLAKVPLFNPFNIWRVVVIITGVDILGYILEKTIGQKKGWLFTSLAGGFISSTSTTQSLALKSKNSKDINKLTAGAIFANFSSFTQLFILVVTVNGAFFIKSFFYILSLLVTSFAAGIYFLNKEEKSTVDNLTETKKILKDDKIFALGPALKFAVIFLLVTIVTKVSLVFFGDRGFIITAALASVTGLDATTINVSQLAGHSISYKLGLIALIIANAINLLTKSAYSFTQGNRRFAINFFVSSLIIIAGSLVSLIFAT
ncbi:MAG: hypothetical protein UR68_C0047G0011 [Candidatus Roizmanbacteria bacterium GW2011_GWA2_35_19]|uniref:DUF4010 domain-containing protein n=1 Tax=Candidatus Roizmanbacteria bacterium GW2011_GWA2_35_19 TaxID=1618478 RepID=A0A0G0BK47_9BACT|nr:MAG: hypothetical protein UR68_C0047G0011 [Candidatus Roizmanbacteria bacterium GW2011_GWA2_35_19]